MKFSSCALLLLLRLACYLASSLRPNKRDQVDVAKDVHEGRALIMELLSFLQPFPACHGSKLWQETRPEAISYDEKPIPLSLKLFDFYLNQIASILCTFGTIRKYQKLY